MKTIFGLLLSLGLLLASLPAVAAQDVGSAYVDGTGQPAVYTDPDGNEAMILTVTEVDNDFQGYMRGQYADHGYSYRLITITLENVSGTNAIVNYTSFSLIDAQGTSHYREHLRVDEDHEYESDFAMSDGEIVTQELVYMVPAHIDTAMFQWQPEFGHVVLVNLLQGDEEPGAINRGLRAPTFITDDFGNVIATMEVTAVNGNWDQYSEWSAPEDGHGYWALRVKVTNESDRPVSVDRFRFNAITQNGESVRTAIVATPEEIANDIYGSVELMPGDAVEGILIFEIAEGDSPSILQWNNRTNPGAMVILMSDAPIESPAIATPAAD